MSRLIIARNANVLVWLAAASTAFFLYQHAETAIDRCVGVTFVILGLVAAGYRLPWAGPLRLTSGPRRLDYLMAAFWILLGLSAFLAPVGQVSEPKLLRGVIEALLGVALLSNAWLAPEAPPGAAQASQPSTS